MVDLFGEDKWGEISKGSHFRGDLHGLRGSIKTSRLQDCFARIDKSSPKKDWKIDMLPSSKGEVVSFRILMMKHRYKQSLQQMFWLPIMQSGAKLERSENVRQNKVSNQKNG